jgi:protein-S-isoprenylcysteine O-methyltransferase Ste14
MLLYLAAGLALLLVAFLVFRRVGRDYLEYGKLTRWTASLPLAVFVLYALLVQWGLIVVSWLRWHATGLPLILGLVSGATGLVILAAALGVFASLRRMLGRDASALKQSGIYAWTRNPQLVGTVLILLGFLLVWPTWRLLVCLLAFLPIAHWMVRAEEEHLRQEFGMEYERYCQRTPRYIGIPRRDSR